ncbi:hypothetical protein [Elizabethkingia ursingii]
MLALCLRDRLQKTNLSGINNKPIIGNLNASTEKNASIFQDTESYVEFNIPSETIIKENGDKWVVFPKVKGDKVIGLVAAILTQNGTYVKYNVYGEQNEWYKQNASLFQDALDKYKQQLKRLNLSASINPIAETHIPGVTVPGKPKLPEKPDQPGWRPDMEPGQDGGGCDSHQDCGAPDSGGGGSDPDSAENMVMPPPPEKPIEDIKKFLSCFDQTKPANLTVYAQNMLASPPGHAFITIQQGNNTMTFGFYPKDPYLNSLSGRGVMGEDSLHPYNQALNVGTISPAQLQNIISRANDYASTRYDLAVRNCADFAREALNIANVPGANWDSNWSRPTDIANIINAQKSGVMGKGNAPATQRSCNN